VENGSTINEETQHYDISFRFRDECVIRERHSCEIGSLCTVKNLSEISEYLTSYMKLVYCIQIGCKKTSETWN
jgi:hypothetical protein